MTEIVKADKQLKKRAYILIIIVMVILAFTQSEYFSNLVTIDTSDMDINQKFEATLQELVYAMSATAFWFLLHAYFSYNLLNIGISSIQGGHHVAQKWRMIGFP